MIGDPSVAPCRLQLSSTEGVGTTVVVDLPVSVSVSVSVPASAAEGA